MADSSKKLEVAIAIDDEKIKKGRPPPRRSVLQRVPAPMRGGNEKEKHIYDPVAVPLGPYHHGRLPEYELAEQLKEELLDMVCDRDRGVPLGLVSERVAEIRQFYGGADGYGDEELAAMMLRDTCFVLCCINLNVSEYDDVISERLGYSGYAFVYRDLLMLENQIPLSLLNLLIPFAFEVDDDDDDDVDVELKVCEFLRFVYYDEGIMAPMTQLPWRNGQEEKPLHLLQVCHRLALHLAKTNQDQGNATNRQPPKYSLKLDESSFHSVTDLKAKGVHFRPSSHSLKDISFFSFSTHGRLHLPLFPVDHRSRVFLSNLVAYEMSSDGKIDLGVTGYVNFMKTLLRRPEDVKLLREKGVIYSTFANDDEVVRLFQDTDTCGLSNQKGLYQVRMRIEKHCNDRGKTWLAELINTYFRSPLTAVALLAAAFILVLTFLQTFYTINPRFANDAP